MPTRTNLPDWRSGYSSEDPWREKCPTCGSTETIELTDERQAITVCANCGSDEPGELWTEDDAGYLIAPLENRGTLDAAGE